MSVIWATTQNSVPSVVLSASVVKWHIALTDVCLVCELKNPMKITYKLPLKVVGILAVTCGSIVSLWAESRNFALPSYRVNAGAVLHVPLTLDNAAGLAALRMQVNFDPEVLTLEAVNTGPLGEAFELSEGEGDGFVQLIFARAEALAGGSGRLASLKFRANPGAVVDRVTELAIADVGLSDATGVIDLRQKDTLILSNGTVAVSALPNIDNSGSGLPDWWEDFHGLDPFANNLELDHDHDGLPGLLEYAFGGNPRVPDIHERGISLGAVSHEGATFLSVGFFRRQDNAKLIYRVQESQDLKFWHDLPLPLAILDPPQDMGDGTEYVEVMGTIPVSGPLAEPKGFMRVKVGISE